MKLWSKGEKNRRVSGANDREEQIVDEKINDVMMDWGNDNVEWRSADEFEIMCDDASAAVFTPTSCLTFFPE